MKIIQVLLFGSILVASEWSVICEDEYIVNRFKGITEVRNDGIIPYLKEHPDANSDSFSKERRLELCREGFKHVLALGHGESGQNSDVLNGDETGELKAYVLVNPPVSADIFADDSVQVRPAYTCPTSPLTYIHVNRDKQDTTTFWVILKKDPIVFAFSKVNTYELYFTEDVHEADVVEMTNASSVDIGNSYFDADALTQDERLQMCIRGMNIAPEIGVVESVGSTNWGKSKYYALWDPVSMDDSLSEQTYWQGFSCPTTPVIYIHIEAGTPESNHIIFWSFLKKKEIAQKPVHNIIGFEVTVAKSVIIGEEITSRNKKETPVAESGAGSYPEEDDGIPMPVKRVNNAIETLNKTSTAMDNLTFSIGELERLSLTRTKQIETPDKVSIATNNVTASIGELERLSLRCQEVRSTVVINTDKWSNEERLYMCSKAISTVLGQTAKFIEDVAGRSLCYRFEYFMNVDGSQILSKKVVIAYQCPTRPKLYLHITRPVLHNSVYLAEVIIMKEDLAFPFVS